MPYPHFVIPAKAGIHHLSVRFRLTVPEEIDRLVMDSHLRGNDETVIDWQNLA
jgi:hypothetical protein